MFVCSNVGEMVVYDSLCVCRETVILAIMILEQVKHIVVLEDSLTFAPR